MLDKDVERFLKEFIAIYEKINGKKITDPSKLTDKKKIDNFIKFILRNYEERFPRYVMDYHFDFSQGINLTTLGMILNEKKIESDLKYPKKVDDDELTTSIFTGGYEKEEQWRDILALKGKKIERIFLNVLAQQKEGNFGA